MWTRYQGFSLDMTVSRESLLCTIQQGFQRFPLHQNVEKAGQHDTVTFAERSLSLHSLNAWPLLRHISDTHLFMLKVRSPSSRSWLLPSFLWKRTSISCMLSWLFNNYKVKPCSRHTYKTRAHDRNRHNALQHLQGIGTQQKIRHICNTDRHTQQKDNRQASNYELKTDRRNRTEVKILI